MTHERRGHDSRHLAQPSQSHARARCLGLCGKAFSYARCCRVAVASRRESQAQRLRLSRLSVRLCQGAERHSQGLVSRLVRRSPSGILRKRPLSIPQYCVQRRRLTRPTQALPPTWSHSAHCGECDHIGGVLRVQTQRSRRWTQCRRGGNLAAGAGADDGLTTWRYLFAGADGRQWHAVRHRHRACYCGSRGDHPRRRQANVGWLQ